MTTDGSLELLTPFEELRLILDPIRARAVIDHRQRIRKPLTAYAARLLAGKFKRAPDPNEAADAMICNGWQGFEPEWMERNSRQLIDQPKPTLAAGFGKLAAEMREQRELRSGESERGVQSPVPNLSIIPGGRR